MSGAATGRKPRRTVKEIDLISQHKRDAFARAASSALRNRSQWRSKQREKLESKLKIGSQLPTAKDLEKSIDALANLLDQPPSKNDSLKTKFESNELAIVIPDEGIDDGLIGELRNLVKSLIFATVFQTVEEEPNLKIKLKKIIIDLIKLDRINKKTQVGENLVFLTLNCLSILALDDSNFHKEAPTEKEGHHHALLALSESLSITHFYLNILSTENVVSARQFVMATKILGLIAAGSPRNALKGLLHLPAESALSTPLPSSAQPELLQWFRSFFERAHILLALEPSEGERELEVAEALFCCLAALTHTQDSLICVTAAAGLLESSLLDERLLLKCFSQTAISSDKGYSIHRTTMDSALWFMSRIFGGLRMAGISLIEADKREKSVMVFDKLWSLCMGTPLITSSTESSMVSRQDSDFFDFQFAQETFEEALCDFYCDCAFITDTTTTLLPALALLDEFCHEIEFFVGKSAFLNSLNQAGSQTVVALFDKTLGMDKSGIKQLSLGILASLAKARSNNLATVAFAFAPKCLKLLLECEHEPYFVKREALRCLANLLRHPSGNFTHQLAQREEFMDAILKQLHPSQFDKSTIDMCLDMLEELIYQIPAAKLLLYNRDVIEIVESVQNVDEDTFYRVLDFVKKHYDEEPQ